MEKGGGGMLNKHTYAREYARTRARTHADAPGYAFHEDVRRDCAQLRPAAIAGERRDGSSPPLCSSAAARVTYLEHDGPPQSCEVKAPHVAE